MVVVVVVVVTRTTVSTNYGHTRGLFHVRQQTDSDKVVSRNT